MQPPLRKPKKRFRPPPFEIFEETVTLLEIHRPTSISI